MIRNLLLTALRSLNKNKFFSLLNILGLGLGMAVFLFIAQYVHFERSYEEFIPDARNIYRVNLEIKQNREQVMASAENFPGVGPALDAEFAEVLGYARLYNLGYKNNAIITNEEAEPDPIAAKHRHFLYADSSFLPMMGYTLLSGDPKTALAEPLTAVISEKYARIYFGDEDPIGKTLRMQDDDYANELVKVTGVFKELPANYTPVGLTCCFSYEDTVWPWRLGSGPV
ncbi:MAG: ABC transporter permease [Bacteroidia bacterium]|nr:ABC transporter permease [Bacteroidia bacterium]